MGKALAIDFGLRRSGLAETDDLKIIATALATVETKELLSFLENYLQTNDVSDLVIGQPLDLKGNINELENDILIFIEKFRIKFPSIAITRIDERFTSKMASFFISNSGKGKKKREEKGLIDKVSATLLLQDFLEQKK